MPATSVRISSPTFTVSLRSFFDLATFSAATTSATRRSTFLKSSSVILEADDWTAAVPAACDVSLTFTSMRGKRPGAFWTGVPGARRPHSRSARLGAPVPTAARIFPAASGRNGSSTMPRHRSDSPRVYSTVRSRSAWPASFASAHGAAEST